MDEKLKYRDFELEDFLNDEFFIQWVKNPGEETNHFWLKWIENNPDKRPLVQQAKEIITMVDYKERYVLSDQAYMDLYEDIVEKSHQRKSDGKQFQWSGWHKTAAILLLVFSTVYGIDLLNKRNQPETEIAKTISWLTVDNPAGQKYRFQLPDGTLVHLNASSKIEYPETFDENHRTIRMQGEAYFDVKKDASRPFIIEDEQNQIKVLGTSFNLKNTGDFELALVEGKVEVADASGDVITLMPNEMLIKEKNGKVSKTGFNPLEVLGWRDQYLIFKDDSFDEVIAKLENWFGVDIQTDLKVDSNWSYSGVYHNKPVNYVLDGISISSEFTYTINKNTVTISNP
ncbi:FecR domain-containing protein [Algoriphagus halophytocola]|uniref:FecR domain-containing protein n=1 Tax=Algoriphagus halophytocola TaxID=2991499 RepID=A0ABY6MGD2_9BACT|nr:MULTISPECIES: FecR family protein [unclassified Algoriphagus]UZD22857.1 FecR domain-containing protein [Algoriphagus sp. TR-M5]WBL44124.1 FecR domain-containing protein [Algoriphagus sp. TR-M9]